MKKYLSFFAIALCAIVSLTSCEEKEETDKLIGTWEWESTTTYYTNGNTYTEYASEDNWEDLTFTGTLIIYDYSDKTPDDIDKLGYTFDGNYIAFLGGLVIWEVEELTNKKLIIKQESYEDDFISIGEGGTDYKRTVYKRK